MKRRSRRNHYDKSVYYSLTLVTQFGINMLVPIFLMSALGVYLDRKLGTSYIMIILFFAGAAAGAQNVYRMAKRIMDKKHSAEDKHSMEEKHSIEKKERKSRRSNGDTGTVKKEK